MNFVGCMWRSQERVVSNSLGKVPILPSSSNSPTHLRVAAAPAHRADTVGNSAGVSVKKFSSSALVIFIRVFL